MSYFDRWFSKKRRKATRTIRPRLNVLDVRDVPAVIGEYAVTQDWGTGYQGEFRFRNPDPAAVVNWNLEFDYAGTLSSIWDARVVSRVGNHYVVSNAGWNADLAANGGRASFGFVVSSPNTGSQPNNVLMNGQAVSGFGATLPQLPSLSIADANVSESAGQVQLTVTLSQAATQAVSVTYATANGSATAGTDYTARSGTISFAAGESFKTFAIPILSDSAYEGNETFTVTLSSPMGATLARGQATVTIVDDDPAPATGALSFRVTNNWGSGFNGEVTARNSGSAPMVNWTVEFDFAGQISSIWNGRIVSQVGNHFIVAGASWNATIPAGGSTSFGFTASPGGASAVLSNLRFGGAPTGPNRPPVAVADSLWTRPGEAATVAVLANDSDPDGNRLSVTTVSQPGHGTVSIQTDGSVRYTPAAGYTGSDTFNYTISDGQGGTASAPVNVTVANSVWPSQYYAPYVDTTLWPTFNFANTAQSAGLRYFTLAFIVADPTGSPAWGGYSDYRVGGNGSFEQGLKSQIASVRALGGDVMVSFGGAANQELALVIEDITQLKNAYRNVINAYQLTHVDFDIEGAACADRASVDRRSQALAQLQTEFRAAGRELSVQLTLPVLPTGLTGDGLYVVQSAKRYGLDLDEVNIMTMDYGDSAAPNPQGRMGDYAIQAAQSLRDQLAGIYGSAKTEAQLWGMIGVTPMIGVNDVRTEVFDQQEAREVLAFAKLKGMERISIWSLNRDRQSSSGTLSYPENTSSSILQSPLEFSLIFDQLTIRS